MSGNWEERELEDLTRGRPESHTYHMASALAPPAHAQVHGPSWMQGQEVGKGA